MRFFLTLLIVFALSTSARAQQPAKVSKIGFLGLTTHSSVAQLYAAFRQRLQELGYLEGQSIVIEFRWADGRAERLPELALELVRLRVEVIVVGPVEPALAARAATTAVPIVFTSVADPVAFGLVTNLARPGGNITGLTSTPGTALNGKRLEMLKEIFPKVSRTAILWNPDNPGSVVNVRSIETPAQSLGIKLQFVELRGGDDLEQAFSEMKRRRAEALYVINSPIIGGQYRLRPSVY
jgi:putative tryptophan/tyrosine transport system substrate-binding protein